MGSLAGATHRQIPHRYDRNVELFDRENTPVEEFVPETDPEAVQPAERDEPTIYFNRFAIHENRYQ